MVAAISVAARPEVAPTSSLRGSSEGATEAISKLIEIASLPRFARSLAMTGVPARYPTREGTLLEEKNFLGRQVGGVSVRYVIFDDLSVVECEVYLVELV